MTRAAAPCPACAHYECLCVGGFEVLVVDRHGEQRRVVRTRQQAETLAGQWRASGPDKLARVRPL